MAFAGTKKKKPRRTTLKKKDRPKIKKTKAQPKEREWGVNRPGAKDTSQSAKDFAKKYSTPKKVEIQDNHIKIIIVVLILQQQVVQEYLVVVELHKKLNHKKR